MPLSKISKLAYFIPLVIWLVNPLNLMTSFWEWADSRNLSFFQYAFFTISPYLKAAALALILALGLKAGPDGRTIRLLGLLGSILLVALALPVTLTDLPHMELDILLLGALVFIIGFSLHLFEKNSITEQPGRKSLRNLALLLILINIVYLSGLSMFHGTYMSTFNLEPGEKKLYGVELSTLAPCLGLALMALGSRSIAAVNYLTALAALMLGFISIWCLGATWLDAEKIGQAPQYMNLADITSIFHSFIYLAFGWAALIISIIVITARLAGRKPGAVPAGASSGRQTNHLGFKRLAALALPALALTCAVIFHAQTPPQPAYKPLPANIDFQTYKAGQASFKIPRAATIRSWGISVDDGQKQALVLVEHAFAGPETSDAEYIVATEMRHDQAAKVIADQADLDDLKDYSPVLAFTLPATFQDAKLGLSLFLRMEGGYIEFSTNVPYADIPREGFNYNFTCEDEDQCGRAEVAAAKKKLDEHKIRSFTNGLIPLASSSSSIKPDGFEYAQAGLLAARVKEFLKAYQWLGYNDLEGEEYATKLGRISLEKFSAARLSTYTDFRYNIQNSPTRNHCSFSIALNRERLSGLRFEFSTVRNRLAKLSNSDFMLLPWMAAHNSKSPAYTYHNERKLADMPGLEDLYIYDLSEPPHSITNYFNWDSSDKYQPSGNHLMAANFYGTAYVAGKKDQDLWLSLWNEFVSSLNYTQAAP